MAKIKSPSIPELKSTGKGFKTGMTDDGLFVIVIDTKVEIGKSKHNNPLFAITNGVCGTPFGKGIFLSLMVGKVANATK
jgi:hypothetical protein